MMTTDRRMRTDIVRESHAERWPPSGIVEVSTELSDHTDTHVTCERWRRRRICLRGKHCRAPGPRGHPSPVQRWRVQAKEQLDWEHHRKSRAWHHRHCPNDDNWSENADGYCSRNPCRTMASVRDSWGEHRTERPHWYSRDMWKMASQADMFERKALPSPWPSWAPFTSPAMSTTFRKAGTLLWQKAGTLLWQKAGTLLWQKAGTLLWQKAGTLLWQKLNENCWNSKPAQTSTFYGSNLKALEYTLDYLFI